MPAPVVAPEAPEAVPTVEELYYVGLRLEQFHNPALEPYPYYEEALRRDPDDSRTNTALGILYCKRAMYPRRRGTPAACACPPDLSLHATQGRRGALLPRARAPRTGESRGGLRRLLPGDLELRLALRRVLRPGRISRRAGRPARCVGLRRAQPGRQRLEHTRPGPASCAPAPAGPYRRGGCIGARRPRSRPTGCLGSQRALPAGREQRRGRRMPAYAERTIARTRLTRISSWR